MSGNLFVKPSIVPVDSSGQPLANATYTFYLSGTTTLTAIYADAALTASLANPVVADAGGVFVPIWLDPDIVYRAVLQTSGGSLVEDVDPYPAKPGIDQTAAELAAGVTPTNYSYQPGDVRRYGAVGDGLTDSSLAFTNAALVGSVCAVATGTWLITSVDVTANNVWFRGEGWNTILKVGATNSRLFNVTGQQFHISDSQWQGDGTTSGATNGVGVYLNNAGNALIENNFSTGFGFGAVSGIAATALIGPKIINHKARLTAALGTEVFLGGIWVDTLIENPNFSSATADRCLLMYDNSTTGWVGVTVRGGSSQGYLKQQWAVTDENWDGTSRVWNAYFDGLRCTQSNWSAIKCKTSRSVRVTHCNFDGCGIAQEDASNGLYGDVLINSLGMVMVDHCQFRNSGSTAIRLNAPLVSQYPSSNPGGKAVSEWRVTGNQIDGTGIVFPEGDGVIIVNGFKGALVDHNIMRAIYRFGVNASLVATSPFWDLGIFNNTVTDSPVMAAAFTVAYGQTLRMDGNLVQNSGASGTLITDVQTVSIGPTDMFLDPAIGSGRGYQIGNCLDLNFKARAGNSTFTAWVASTTYTVGTIRYNGANVYECVVAGTGANAGGPVHTTGGAVEPSATALTWYFVGKYRLCPYAVRLTGTQGKVNLDFDPAGCLTGPIELLVVGTGGTRIHYTTSIATTDATVTNAQVIPIPDLSAWMIEMKVLAFAVGVNRAMYHKTGLFYRAGGNTTLANLAAPLVEYESDAAWLAEPKLSSTNLAPAQVTGAAATNINWAVEITMLGMP